MTGRGLTRRGVAEFARVAASHVGDTAVPGLVALVAAGDDVHVEAVGHLAVGGPRVARDSLFRIASMTKPMTAATTLALAAEGLLDLDEPVDRLLPELAGRRVLRRPDGPLDDTVPAHRPVTARDLLTFTWGFGIPPEAPEGPEGWPVLAEAARLRLGLLGPPDPGVPPEPDTWAARLGTLPLVAQPGERWLYGAGSSVLGVLLARAAGQPLGEVLRTRLLAPLGMADTGFWSGQAHRLATAYTPVAGPGGTVLTAWDLPDGRWSRPPAFPDGAAGLLSTADDVLALARVLTRGGAGVLPAAAVRAMTSDQLTPAQKARGGLLPGFFTGQSWGFGLVVRDGGDVGWAGGLGTTLLADPARDVVVVVLTQRAFADPGAPPVHEDLQAAALAAVA